MRKVLDVTHVPYPTKLRSPFANVTDDEPDVMCLSKGIGSSLPSTICLVRSDIMNWPLEII